MGKFLKSVGREFSFNDVPVGGRINPIPSQFPPDPMAAQQFDLQMETRPTFLKAFLANLPTALGAGIASSFNVESTGEGAAAGFAGATQALEERRRNQFAQAIARSRESRLARQEQQREEDRQAQLEFRRQVEQRLAEGQDFRQQMSELGMGLRERDVKTREELADIREKLANAAMAKGEAAGWDVDLKEGKIKHSTIGTFPINDVRLNQYPEAKAMIAAAKLAESEAEQKDIAKEGRSMARALSLIEARAEIPTSATRTMAETAPKVRGLVTRIRPQIQAVRNQLGPASGRWSEFYAGRVGANDPKFTSLRTNIGLLRTLLMRMHVGARGGQQLLEYFTNLIDSGKQSPENLEAALDAIDQYAADVAGGGKGAPQEGGGRVVDFNSLPKKK